MTAATITAATYQQVRGATEWGTGTNAYNDMVGATATAINSHATDIDAINATIAAGIDLTNTSTSSNTIGTGSKSWTLATAKSYQIGQWVTLTDAGTPTNYALGQVTAWNSGTKVLTVNVTVTSGSGTITSWTVQYSSPPDQTVNISGLTELTGLIASNDMLVIYDASAGANKKISMKTLELHFRSILGV